MPSWLDDVDGAAVMEWLVSLQQTAAGGGSSTTSAHTTDDFEGKTTLASGGADGARWSPPPPKSRSLKAKEKNVKDFDFCSNPFLSCAAAFLVVVVSGLFLLRWSFLSSFLKRLSKSWQLTKIFQTQLRKSPKTTMSTSMVLHCCCPGSSLQQ